MAKTIKYVTMVVLVIIAAFVFLFIREDRGAELEESAVPVPEISERTVTSSEKKPNEYRNEKFHFTLLYPPDIPLEQQIFEEDSLTVVFQAQDGAHGFQIFVTPYAGQEITRERFLQDIPSGVMINATNITIDGVPATRFFSESLIGETVEIWFIKNGLLYEIVSYKELEPWLWDIVQSWKFI